MSSAKNASARAATNRSPSDGADSDASLNRTVDVRQRCTSCPIRARAICSNCDHDELVALDDIKAYRTFQPGDEIFAAGERTPFLGTIVLGVVKLTKTLSDGRRQLVGLQFASDFVGRVGEPTARYDAVAAAETTLCVFERNRFEHMISSTPHLEQRLLQMTMDELDASREWLFLLGRKTAKEKVATFLCMLARRGAASKTDQAPTNEDSVRVDIPLSRDDMSDYLGLTIETVSRQMSALRKAGVIVFDEARMITVPSMADLLAESGDEDEEFL